MHVTRKRLYQPLELLLGKVLHSFGNTVKQTTCWKGHPKGLDQEKAGAGGAGD